MRLRMRQPSALRHELCAVIDCDKPAGKQSLNLCVAHYNRKRKYQAAWSPNLKPGRSLGYVREAMLATA
jgi:hypothetical protein